MIQTLGPPPTETILDASNDEVDISASTAWTSFFNMTHQVLVNVGPQLRVEAILDFPSTPSFSSSDLTMAVPGTLPGMQLSFGAPVPPAGCTYSAYPGIDIVTVRFLNATAAPVDPPIGDFRVAVHTGEESV